MRRRDFLAGSAAGAVGLLTLRSTFAQEASNTARQAFSFGYPLVLMDLTHRAMAGGGNPDQPAPFNRFFHFTQLPTAQFNAIVCPVIDSLHSSAWLNVKDEPVVVSIPPLGGRFCTGSFFHAWYDVLGRIGAGESGGKGADYLVTGPGWAGAAPSGVVEIKSPTNMVWAPIWLSVAGPDDLAAAVELQSQFKVTPLKDWKGPTAAPPGGGLASLLGSFFKTAPAPGAPPAAALGPDGIPLNAGEMPAPEAAPPKVDAEGKPVPAAEPEAAPPAEATPPPAGEGAMEAEAVGEGGAQASGTSPNAVLFTMDVNTFYTRLCQLMADNPPLEADAAIVGKMAKLGLTPGATIDIATQSRTNQIALVGGMRNAGQKIFTTKAGLKLITANRWETALGTFEFGTNYDRRAHAALMHFGASQPEDVLCPRTAKDAAGKPLQSNLRYTLTFAAGQLPPVKHSWSLAAYKSPVMELGETAGGKQGVSSHNPLVTAPDGSLTLYIQKDSPGPDKEANWVPVPDGPFELLLRLCGPTPDVASLAWKPPGVARA